MTVVCTRTMGDGSGPSGGLAPAGHVSPRGEGVITAWMWRDETGATGWEGGPPPVRLGRWYEADLTRDLYLAR